MHLDIVTGQTVNVDHRSFEMVERKGAGHPDTLCDRAGEELSVALSRYYLEHFGAILHHNTDKVLLVGGRAHATFGRGGLLDPMYLLMSGRATMMVEGESIPVGEIAVRRTAAWLSEALPHLHMPGDLIVDYRIKPSSPDLVALYYQPGVPLANDTSFAVAYTPLSRLEHLVKSTEIWLNGPEMKTRFPQIGQDIKVMGQRSDSRIMLTIAAAFIAAETPDLETYLAVKEELGFVINEKAAALAGHDVQVSVNTADRLEEGFFYVTATGTSAEQGDDGQVGRGNRVNGLITPMRPMSLEAAAGKNPVSHVGKLYQVYAQLMVNRICAEIPEVAAASCALLSRIGSPINQPQAVSVHLETAHAAEVLRAPVAGIVRSVLDDWAAIRDGFLQRRWELY